MESINKIRKENEEMSRDEMYALIDTMGNQIHNAITAVIQAIVDKRVRAEDVLYVLNHT